MATYIKVRNLQDSMKQDFERGRGIKIFEPTFGTKKEKTRDGELTGKKEKNYHGLQSTFFSTSWEDGEEAFSERFSCKCGDLQGGLHEGEICPICETEVVFVDVDVNKFGWMTLDEFFVLNPAAFFKIQAFVGKEPLSIITGTEFEESKKVPDKFNAIGLTGLKDNFLDVIEFAFKKKKKKVLEYEEIIKMYKDGAVFTNAIPVVTNILRPYSINNSTMRYSVLDKQYEPMRTAIEALNKMIEHTIGSIEEKMLYVNKKLRSIQRRYNNLYNKTFEIMNGKDGHIRDQLLGGRLNWSSRNVIISDEYLRANEVKLSYHAILELYRYELIGMLCKIHDITINEAIDEISWAKISFSKKIFALMQYMIEKYDYRILINRNPTIDFGSILLMKIKEVTYSSSDDFTMSIPIQSLSVLNADFDGDIANIIALKTEELVDEYMLNDPTLSMYISNNDGLFNNDFNLIKDQIISLYQFNNI